MPQSADANADPALDVVPEVAPASDWRVRAIEVLDHGRLRVTFRDGTTGDVDLRAFLSSDRVRGTVFEALRDPDVFTTVSLTLGAVTWPCGADLAPDTLYDAIRSGGVCTLA